MFNNLKYLTIIIVLVLTGCGGSGSETPVDKLKQQFKDVPTYSIILDDMKEDGNFFTHYFHKYKIVQPDNAGTTDWIEVSEDFYRLNENFLGMTLAAKKEGESISQKAPPGYAYVGDDRYGKWKQDSSGNSFWEFYGKYAMLSQFMGMFSQPVYRSDYDTYRTFKSRNTPFYGTGNEYGTKGSVTKKKKPDFFSRRMDKKQKSKSSFIDKVSKRMGKTSYSPKQGRTRTSFRSRSTGRGK
ncbi:Lipoprotein [Candidatus Magnetomoraceae bacterium gMMP-13]